MRASTQAKWAERVAGWKASGLPSREYCEGRPFTDGGLRHWAYRLRQGRERKTDAPAVRVARVVRVVESRIEPERHVVVPVVALLPPPLAASANALAIECGELRVAVRPGFDRATLDAILDVLAARRTGQ